MLSGYLCEYTSRPLLHSEPLLTRNTPQLFIDLLHQSSLQPCTLFKGLPEDTKYARATKHRERGRRAEEKEKGIAGGHFKFRNAGKK